MYMYENAIGFLFFDSEDYLFIQYFIIQYLCKSIELHTRNSYILLIGLIETVSYTEKNANYTM